MYEIASSIKIRIFIALMVTVLCIGSSPLARAESTQGISASNSQNISTPSTTSVDPQIAVLTALLQKLIELYEQLLSAQNIKVATPTQKETNDTKTSIKLITPDKQTITLGQPINLAWEYKNAPKNTQVVYTMTLIKKIPSTVYNSIMGGNGATLTQLDKNGTGKTSWKTGDYNSGYMNTPGVYRLGASIRDCHPDGCAMNASFPGLNLNIKTYAEAEPITVTVIEPVITQDYSKPSAQLLSPHSGTYKIGDRMIIEWKNNNLPSGSRVCALLQNADSKQFVFTDDNDKCISSILMKDVNTFSGTLVRKTGYMLSPGKYRVMLEVTTPSGTPVSAGKEGGNSYYEVGGWFDIL